MKEHDIVLSNNLLQSHLGRVLSLALAFAFIILPLSTTQTASWNASSPCVTTPLPFHFRLFRPLPSKSGDGAVSSKKTTQERHHLSETLVKT